MFLAEHKYHSKRKRLLLKCYITPKFIFTTNQSTYMQTKCCHLSNEFEIEKNKSATKLQPTYLTWSSLGPHI